MKWIRFEADTDPEICEEVSKLLMDSGSRGVEVADPEEAELYSAGLSPEEYEGASYLPDDIDGVRITAYYPEDTDISAVSAALSEMFGAGIRKTGTGISDDADWQDCWKKYYSEFTVGNRLFICPGWKTLQAPGGRKKLLMDPGMAFGSGDHETTFMCLEALDMHLNHGETVLDVGTGSGILAIAAVKLGAQRVDAIDIDSTAVSAAQKNVRRNRAGKRISIFKAFIEDLGDYRYDIIVANIVAGVLTGISAEVASRIKPGGLIILSGIISEKKDLVVEAYERLGFILKEERKKNEWVALVFYAKVSDRR